METKTVQNNVEDEESVEEVREIRKKLSQECRNMSYEELTPFLKS